MKSSFCFLHMKFSLPLKPAYLYELISEQPLTEDSLNGLTGQSEICNFVKLCSYVGSAYSTTAQHC